MSAFLPFDDEPDLRSVFPALELIGARVLLPCIGGRTARLTFRAWSVGDALAPGHLGTRHPANGPEADPDLLLVPLLAFDRAGHRLGRGGGFYDRTMTALASRRAIGVAWACREVDAVPVGPFDATLDAVVTENGVVATRPET